MSRKKRQRRSQSPSARPFAAGNAGPANLSPLEAENLFRLAAQSQQAGNLAQARDIYLKVLPSQPDNPDLLHIAGVLCQQTGMGDDALRLIGRAVKLRPDSADFVNNLGNIHMERGEPDKAAKCYGRALALNPSLFNAHYNLGNLHKEKEEYDEATAHFRKAIELEPGYFKAHLNLGNVLHDTGRLEEAIAAFREVVRLAPDFAQGWHNLALVERDDDRLDESAEHFRKALALDPGIDEAVGCYAGVLVRMGRPDDGIEQYEILLSRDPDRVATHVGIGDAHVEAGRFDGAIACFEKALALDPSRGGAYAGIANARKTLPESDLPARAEALLEKTDPSAEEAVPLHFALGKMYDDLKSFDAAFRHYRQGNQIFNDKRVEKNRGFDPEKWKQSIDSFIGTFTPAFFEERRSFGADSELPVFIVGMPRSATTLTEQIVSSHPLVHGAGELTKISSLSKDMRSLLKSDSPYPECVDGMDAATARDLAGSVLENLRKHGGGAVRVTDKMPGNFLHLGLIALLLPKAKLIHCRRDPLDTCLSIYFHHFAAYHPYAYDLKNLGYYYRQYERLMAHWRDALPVEIFEVRYEEMVANQEEVSRKLVDFCGLDWDERCLSFHQSKRSVRTASNWQVRQPIYKSAVQRWKRYERHLGPLKEALDVS